MSFQSGRTEYNDNRGFWTTTYSPALPYGSGASTAAYDKSLHSSHGVSVHVRTWPALGLTNKSSTPRITRTRGAAVARVILHAAYEGHWVPCAIDRAIRAAGACAIDEEGARAPASPLASAPLIWPQVRSPPPPAPHLAAWRFLLPPPAPVSIKIHDLPPLPALIPALAAPTVLPNANARPSPRSHTRHETSSRCSPPATPV
ncbi:hypothetical protein DAEQUDRAFT_550620 [Daedalea quercina L-15889]|uniref:Uncharacterized protein n=1 Tax=Daedalea quercina L-15889 TaxID=1314783 RepID=A0A165T341_9APHY|nr:hypothetical protein DAEQUDRAFT_550620 [Daedalea quercina L-15889]